MSFPGTPPFDPYLQESYDLIKAVYERIDAIQAVANHLTPVEDLVEFKNEVEALYAKLTVLVAASEIIVQITPAGFAMIVAEDAPAQRYLLGLKSAALRPEEYFATAEGLAQLATLIAGLQLQIDELFLELAKKVDRDEFLAAIQGLEGRIGSIEEGITGTGGLNERIQEIIADLESGEYMTILIEDITDLRARITVAEDGLSAEAHAREVLSVRVTYNEHGIEAVSQHAVTLEAEVGNLKTGQSAQATAIDTLTARAGLIDGELIAQSTLITGLDARVTDTEDQVEAHAGALQTLEVLTQTNANGIQSLALQSTQLNARVDDVEAEQSFQANALQALSATVDLTNDALTIAGESITQLQAAITGSGNLLPNSAFEVDLDGWVLYSRGTGWLAPQLERDMAAERTPPGMHTLGLTNDNVPAGNAGIRSTMVPVEARSSMIVSGYLAAENVTLRLEWRVYDGNGAQVGLGLVGEVTDVAPAENLVDWTRVHAKVPIPVDGAFLEVQAWLNDAHEALPSAWLLRPMVETAVGSQSTPSSWVPGYVGIEAAMAEATEQLTVRIEQTETALSIASGSLTDLSSRIGALSEWRVTTHMTSDTWEAVGAPFPPSLRQINAELPVTTFTRGLTLVRFSEGGELLSATNYDTYSTVSERTDLAAALNALTYADPFMLVAQDNHGIQHPDLTAALENCGALAYSSITGSRAYILFGAGNLGKGGGIEVFPATDQLWINHTFTLVNDVPKGLNEKGGLLEALAVQATAIDNLSTSVDVNADGIASLAGRTTSLEASVNVLPRVFLQPTEPDAGTQGPFIIGDMWLDSDNGNSVSVWNGTSWAESASVAGATIYAQTTPPTGTGLNVGDLWFDTDNGFRQHRWNGTQWIDITDQRIVSNATALTNLSAEVVVIGNQVTTNSNSLTLLETELDGKASTSAVNSLDARMTEVEGDISTNTAAITDLSTEVDGKASVNAVDTLSGRIDVNDDFIAAHGQSLTQLTANLGDSILLLNPEFELVPAGWQASAYTINNPDAGLPSNVDIFGPAGALANSGNYSLRVQPPSSADTTRIYNSHRFAIAPGERVNGSIRFRSHYSSPPPAGTRVTFGVRWYNADNGYLSESVPAGVTFSGSGNYFYGNAAIGEESTAPSSAAYGRYFIHISAAFQGAPGPLYFDTATAVRGAIPATAAALNGLTVRVSAAENELDVFASDITELRAGLNSRVTCVNPSFEDGAEGWSSSLSSETLPANTSIGSTAGAAYTGRNYLRLDADDGSGRAIYNRVEFPVAGGEKVRLRAYTRTAGATSNGAQIRIALRVTRVDGGTTNHYIPWKTSSGGTWLYPEGVLDGELTMPADAVTARVFIFSQALTSGSILVDSVEVHLPTLADRDNASATSALTVRVSNVENDVVVQAGQLTDLSSEIDGKASAALVNQLQTQVTQTQNGVTANSSAITKVTASLGSSSGNLLGNSDFAFGLDGWNKSGTPAGILTDAPYAAYTPPGRGMIYLRSTGKLANGAYIDAHRFGTDDRVQVEGGNAYIFSAYLGAHRCQGFLYIRWYDTAGNHIKYGGPSNGITSNGGAYLSAFGRAYVRSVAPANAASAGFIIRAFGNTETGSDSYLFITCPMFEEVSELQTTPSPYSVSASDTASITQSAKVSADSVTGKFNASITNVLDVNGNISGTKSENNGKVSRFSILTTVFRVVSSLTSMGMEWQDGYLRIWRGAAQLLIGHNFGANHDMILWYGPNIAVNTLTKGNATIWFDTSGSAYFGGSLSAGVLKNAAQSTQISGNASVETGEFGTNGNQKIVTYSLNFDCSGAAGTAPGFSDNTNMSVTMTLQRSYNNGGWVTLSSRTLTAVTSVRDQGSDAGNARYAYRADLFGSSTFTDNLAGTGNFNYRVVLSNAANFPLQPPAGRYYAQNLSVVSAEN